MFMTKTIFSVYSRRLGLRLRTRSTLYPPCRLDSALILHKLKKRDSFRSSPIGRSPHRWSKRGEEIPISLYLTAERVLHRQSSVVSPCVRMKDTTETWEISQPRSEGFLPGLQTAVSASTVDPSKLSFSFQPQRETFSRPELTESFSSHHRPDSNHYAPITGHHPPWHGGEDPHALSDVRYSSLVWMPSGGGGRWGSGGLLCGPTWRRRRSSWELSRLNGALQVVWRKVTLSWALIKTSLPRWSRSSLGRLKNANTSSFGPVKRHRKFNIFWPIWRI